MNNLNDIFFSQAASEGLTYEQILEDVQRYFSENHASTIAEAGDGDTERAASVLKELMAQYLVKRRYSIEGLTPKELCEKLYEDMAGYSFLKKWIYRPGVEEVNINAYNDIEVIMNSGRSLKIPDKFSSPQHAIDVIRRMLNACGMVIDDTMPSVLGFLDKNIRISVDKTPIVDPEVGGKRLHPYRQPADRIGRNPAGIRQRHGGDAPFPDRLHPLRGIGVHRRLHGLRQDHHHGLAPIQRAQQPAPDYH